MRAEFGFQSYLSITCIHSNLALFAYVQSDLIYGLAGAGGLEDCAMQESVGAAMAPHIYVYTFIFAIYIHA